ncbi:MAG: sulfite exporter TauE/SafE family protein, partial [Deltaproteobacteria bacterium]|nr:sulfite exporter TauE/SafE family protein [Deltaproteobacteria bacterium]
MFDFAIAGVQAPIFLLALVGLTVGIVGGFIGVGGGYMVTPALIVFGFPGYMASGIDMTHICGKGLVSTVRHRQLGNIDWTLALSMIAGTMLGVELGVRLLVYFKNLGISGVVLLVTSVALMFTLFLYTQMETRRAHKKMEEMEKEGKEVGRELQTSNLPKIFQTIPLAPIIRCRTARVIVSMWVIVLVGMVTGALAGFLGVGGGFIRVPALVYVVGASTHIAVGTDLVEIVVSGAYGALRHSIEGNVDMMAVIFMIVGAMFGAQVGSIATSYVRGPAIRYILSYSLILATLGAALRLIYVLTGQNVHWLSLAAVVLTLGEMIFLCLFISSLVWFAVRRRGGKWVPDWVGP